MGKLSLGLLAVLAVSAISLVLFAYPHVSTTAKSTTPAFPSLKEEGTPLLGAPNGYYMVNSLAQYDYYHIISILQWVGGEGFIDDPLNPVVQQLLVEFTIDNYNEVSLLITDVKDTRFSLPYAEPFPFNKSTRSPNKDELVEYVIGVPGDQFYLKLWRKDTGEMLFDSTNNPFIFQDKYMEISTNFGNGQIFGLGERRMSYQLTSGKYSIWAADAARIDYGYPGQQIYGTHPMYLRRDANSHKFHVVFLRNAYGMEIDYTVNQKLTYKVIGGTFDFKFFIGDTNPEEPIKLYHDYINGWILHPFWVQGYHQCRWGYKTSQELEDVWNKFNELSIPIDSLWSDIDYMYEFYDFSIDLSRFSIPQMQNIYDKSKPEGVHWSSIIDVGIALPSDAATRGQELNTFIKSGVTGEDLIGEVWPGVTYYPDFNHPNSTQFWYEGLSNITKNYGLEQEGIWIDMNEFSNFVNGEVLPTPPTPAETTPAPSKAFLKEAPAAATQEKADVPTFYLPFNPQGDTPIDEKTLSLNAQHYNKKDALMVYSKTQNITQYDMHNLNGFGEGIATYKAAKMMGKNLTFILSRSTLFGSGKYVQHWNGDGFSEWDYLKYTIPGIINFQMYGIPFVGDDICGLNGNATAELCGRWMQLGSLYPFSRNHNGNASSPQEPYAFPETPYVLNSSIKTLTIRYQLLKFYYHLFVRLNGSGTVFRPLIWEFPSDDVALQQETQFLLGDYLMAAPVTYPGNSVTETTTLNVYFPAGAVYYDFYTQDRFEAGNQSFDIPFDSVVPLYVKSGKIVHFQPQGALRSRFLDNVFSLNIALDGNLSATGTILTINDYNDEMNIINSCIGTAQCVTKLIAEAKYKSESQLTLTINNKQEAENTIFQEIVIDTLIVTGIPFHGIYLSKTISLNVPYKITGTNQSIQVVIDL